MNPVLLSLLMRSRKVITDQPGWDDDEECVEVVSEIDEIFGGDPTEDGRGAYDR